MKILNQQKSNKIQNYELCQENKAIKSINAKIKINEKD